MLRSKWEFQYAADKLAVAAKAKHDYHVGRLAAWKAKQEEVKAKIQKEGIEIDDSLVEEMTAASTRFSSSNSAYRGPSVNIRNDLVKDLNETVDKVNEHKQKIHDYDGWRQVLAAQGTTVVMLNHDDWLFFFGGATTYADQ